MNPQDRPFDERARALFARHCQHTTAEERLALQRARLTATSAPRRSRPLHLWLPAGAAASLALALAVGLHQAPAPAPAQAPALASVPPENASDLYQNLDFYLWLAAQDESAPAPASAATTP